MRPTIDQQQHEYSLHDTACRPPGPACRRRVPGRSPHLLTLVTRTEKPLSTNDVPLMDVGLPAKHYHSSSDDLIIMHHHHHHHAKVYRHTKLTYKATPLSNARLLFFVVWTSGPGGFVPFQHTYLQCTPIDEGESSSGYVVRKALDRR